MNIKQNWKLVTVVSLLVVNTVSVLFILLYLFVPRGVQGELQYEVQGRIAFDDIKYGKYILYIGTNDKYTYEQIIPTDEARQIVNEICSRHVGGYTVMEAMGGWVDEKGILTQEHTLVYSFIYTDEDAIIAIMDEVLVALNQNSILIERADVSSSFYRGR